MLYLRCSKEDRKMKNLNNTPTLKKEKSHAFGKDIFLLGVKDGRRYWLEAPSWDCGWYWGFGYVETYTNNAHPERSRDIESHQHFDGLFLNDCHKCGRDKFAEFFDKTTLTENEIWELVDYMKTFYTLKETAELFKHGYSWQTERAKIDQLKSDEQADLVNQVWLPEVFKRIKTLLTPKA